MYTTKIDVITKQMKLAHSINSRMPKSNILDVLGLLAVCYFVLNKCKFLTVSGCSVYLFKYLHLSFHELQPKYREFI